MQICQVLAPSPGVTRFEGTIPAGRPPARRARRRHGDAASRWDLALNGQGRVVLITGQGGSASRAPRPPLRTCSANKACHLQIYQCSHLYQNTAFYPLISRIIRDTKIRFSDKPDEKLRKLGPAAAEQARGEPGQAIAVRLAPVHPGPQRIVASFPKPQGVAARRLRCNLRGGRASWRNKGQSSSLWKTPTGSILLRSSCLMHHREVSGLAHIYPHHISRRNARLRDGARRTTLPI